MSPEDQRVWEEDAETEYAEAHAQAKNATLGHADAEKVSQDVAEVERARVARYAEAICRAESVWLNLSDAPEEVQAEYQREARAVVAVADEERGALVDEVERLRGQVRRVRALADAFADDGLMRHGGNIAWHIEEAIANEKGDFPDAADQRIASQRERAEAAEAKLAKVEALADAWESGAPGLEWNVPIGMTFASHLRAALADAPTECGAEHPTNPTAVPCIRDAGHEGSHMSTTGCGGSVMHWPDAPTEQRAEGGA